MTKSQLGARDTKQEEVTEGGKAQAPKEPNGQMKPAASSSPDLDGSTEGTSHATTAKAEKQRAEEAGRNKPT